MKTKLVLFPRKGKYRGPNPHRSQPILPHPSPGPRPDIRQLLASPVVAASVEAQTNLVRANGQTLRYCRERLAVGTDLEYARLLRLERDLLAERSRLLTPLIQIQLIAAFAAQPPAA